MGAGADADADEAAGALLAAGASTLQAARQQRELPARPPLVAGRNRTAVEEAVGVAAALPVAAAVGMRLGLAPRPPQRSQTTQSRLAASAFPSLAPATTLTWL